MGISISLGQIKQNQKMLRQYMPGVEEAKTSKIVISYQT